MLLYFSCYTRSKACLLVIGWCKGIERAWCVGELHAVQNHWSVKCKLGINKVRLESVAGRRAFYPLPRPWGRKGATLGFSVGRWYYQTGSDCYSGDSGLEWRERDWKLESCQKVDAVIQVRDVRITTKAVVVGLIGEYLEDWMSRSW